jgi:hypothetical protein
MSDQVVYVVEHEDVGAVAVFSTRSRAERFITGEGTGGAYDSDSLSITGLVVDE